MIAHSWRLGGLAALLALTIGAACADGEAASVETVVQEYLRAVSEADAELFCASIEPQLGFFSDEANCLEVQRYGQRSDFAPRIRGRVLSDVTSQLLSFEDVDVSADEAAARVTVRWTGVGTDGAEELGEAELTFRLVRAGDEWRIASFENSALSPSKDPEVQAVSLATVDYFEALARALGTERSTRFWSETPVMLGEHRSRRLLSAIVSVEFKEGYAAATIDTHNVSNGAFGYPSRAQLVWERGVSGWRLVANADPALLFEDP